MGAPNQIVLWTILFVFATCILPSQSEEIRVVTPSAVKKCMLQQLERKDQLMTDLIEEMLGMLNDAKEKIRSERRSFKCSKTEYIGGYSTPQKFRVTYNDKDYRNNAFAMHFMSRRGGDDIFNYDVTMLPMCKNSKTKRSSDFELCVRERVQHQVQLTELQILLEQMQETLKKIDECKDSLKENIKSKK